MPRGYAPVLNPASNRLLNQQDREAELQAAFDYSDDEDDEHTAHESQPLNPQPTSAAPAATNHSPSGTPRTYNFENVDYDYPPPGSPPPPSAAALPNNIGNSNGLIPSPSSIQHPRSRQGWLRRTVAAVLPNSILTSLNRAPYRPPGPIGGGTNNDGVFANVTAKPSPPVIIQDGDDTYLVPEDTRQEAPPSYASAQADAVPPYWETTVHAPFSPNSMGELMIDALPTGSLFSFCWNLLVSVSFQFVGFLLTYLLHTSHAARLGSRAGLGITLIQYGFALRSRMESTDGAGGNSWDDWNSNSQPADGTHRHANNITWSTPLANVTDEQAAMYVAGATSEWLSFFLMTVGWFVLLTSLLGFWRVKRWERGVLAAQSEQTATPVTGQTSTPLVSRLESSFGLRGISRSDFLRQGFGFGRSRNQEEEEIIIVNHAEQGDLSHGSAETDPMIPIDPSNPERTRAILQAFANERRLQRDLHDAGLI